MGKFQIAMEEESGDTHLPGAHMLVSSLENCST